SEAKGSTDYANNIQTLIAQDCTAIVTVGFLQSQATIEAAAANPTVAFAQVDTSWGCGPDFKCGTADDKEPANYTGLDYHPDPAKGEQLAKTMHDQGVDIIHPVAGATGNGSIKAAQEGGYWAIGVDTDQYISIGPPTNAALLTSAQKAIDVSVLDFFNHVETG